MDDDISPRKKTNSVFLREAAVDLVYDASGVAQRLEAFQHRVLNRRNDVGNRGAPIHGDVPP